MMCVNPKAFGTKLLGSRGLVPCGKCHACRTNRRDDWYFRLLQERKDWKFAYFVTLTYADEFALFNTSGDVCLHKPHLQAYIRRYRDNVGDCRYYAVGEYGTDYMRGHYHIILFTNVKDNPFSRWSLSKLWDYGYVTVSVPNARRYRYTLKYHLGSVHKPDNAPPPFTLMSRKPGLGSRYLRMNSETHIGNIDMSYVVVDGKRHAMPRYYKDKLYTKEERLAISVKFSPDPEEEYQMVKAYEERYPDSDFWKHKREQVEARERQFKEKRRKSNAS